VKKPPNTSGKQLIQRNPEQRLAPKVAKALSDRRAALTGIVHLRNQNDLSAGARKKLLNAKLDWYRAVAKSIGLDFEKVSAGLKDAVIETNSHIADTLKQKSDKWKNYLTLKPGDLVFPKPQLTDPFFWWAETTPMLAPEMTANFLKDGLHFSGGPKVNNYNDDIRASFGATAHFALQPERRPNSVFYKSSPSVEILGGVDAFAPDYDYLQGHGIASCSLVLRQMIFQWGFGQTGPVQVSVAQAVSNDQWLINVEDEGFSVHQDMPGLISLPPVTFNISQFHANEDLWAELEVRFDIYIKQEGALLWCNPDVILRTFQWPLEPRGLP
jgi:hypothetical protein